MPVYKSPKSGMAERAKTKDPNAMDIDATQSSNTSVSTAAESTLPKNAKNQSCSTASASSSAAVIRRTAPVRARAAVRLVAPRQKKVQHPGMRLKAPKIKKKTRARAKTGPSPSKECLWQGMSLVQRLWNPGCEVRKSLGSRHQSGCAKSHNRYDILSMEEIEESKDFTDYKIISNSTLPSEGSPSGLARDVKPGLNSSN